MMKLIKTDRWNSAAVTTGAIKVDEKTVEEAEERLRKVWPNFQPEVCRYTERKNGVWCYFEGKVKNA